MTPPGPVPPVPAPAPLPWLRPIWLALIILGATLVALLSVIVLRLLGRRHGRRDLRWRGRLARNCRFGAGVPNAPWLMTFYGPTHGLVEEDHS